MTALSTTPRTAVVTIVGSNYLSRAGVLRASVRRHHPEWEFVTVVVDVDPGTVLEEGDVGEVWTPEDLGIDPVDLTVMGFLYNVTEFCTAIKPAALLRLLDDGADRVLYIDPDTRFFAPADSALALLTEHDVVLTPHSLVPIPDDGLDPTNDNIRSCGSFNLGFFACRAGARGLLTWWADMLVLGAGIELELNRFTDQRWMDQAPSFADVGVLRDPAVNVAYWNLHERTLAEDPDGTVTIDGTPLVLFHFSGYDPSTPWQLSKYIRRRPRVHLSDSPVLGRLCAAYRVDLLAWEEVPGRDGLTDREYRRNRLGDLRQPGEHVRSGLRAMLRDERIAGRTPLTSGSTDPTGALRAWLLDPPADAPATGVPRLLWAAWNSRIDLRAAHPDPHGLSRRALLAWAREHGPAEEGLPADVDLLVATHSSRSAPADPGTNVVGQLTTRSATGSATRRVLAALAASASPDRPVHGVPAGIGGADVDPDLPVRPGDGLGAATVWCADGDDLRAVRDSVPTVARASRVEVVYWAGERDPDPRAPAVDEIWAPTRFVADRLVPPPGVPVVSAPLLVDPDPLRSDLTRTELGLPADAIVLLARVDLLDSVARQNPDGLLDAFLRAFPTPGRAFLLVSTRHGGLRPDALDRLAWRVRDRPDVAVRDFRLGVADDGALTAASDCVVSLHRAVAVGADLVDAMALGRATVATAWSGNLDVCTDATTRLVPARLVPVEDPDGFYAAEGEWAEPDPVAAAEALAAVVADAGLRAALGEAGRRRVRELADPAAFAAFADDRLHRLMSAASGLRPATVPDPEAIPSGSPDPWPGEIMRSESMPVQLPPVESVLAYGRADAGRFRSLLRRVVFSLTKSNLYYSRSLVESALEQLGVPMTPLHRVVGSTDLRRVPPTPAVPRGPAGDDSGSGESAPR